MWVNFTVRSVKPSVRWIARWDSEGWGQEGLQIRSEQGAESQSWKVRDLGCGWLYTHSLIHTCACTQYVLSPKQQWGVENKWAQKCRHKYVAKKDACVCKQSASITCAERINTGCHITSCHSQPSYRIPSSHLHIKHSSHSRSLTNNLWMLLALSQLHLRPTQHFLRFSFLEMINTSRVSDPFSPLAMFYSYCGLTASQLGSVVSLQFYPSAAQWQESPLHVTAASHTHQSWRLEEVVNWSHLSKQMRTNFLQT